MISYPSVNSFFAWLFRETVLILGTSAQSASLAGWTDKENHFKGIQDFLNRLCRGTGRSSRMSAPSQLAKNLNHQRCRAVNDRLHSARQRCAVSPCWNTAGMDDRGAGRHGWLGFGLNSGYYEALSLSERNLLCQERFGNSSLIWRQQDSRTAVERGATETLSMTTLPERLLSRGKAATMRRCIRNEPLPKQSRNQGIKESKS